MNADTFHNNSFYYDSQNQVFHNLNKKTPFTGFCPVGLGNFCKKNLKKLLFKSLGCLPHPFLRCSYLKFQAIVGVSFVLLI